jgi:hypothetical protein
MSSDPTFPFWKQKYRELPANTSDLLSTHQYAEKYSYSYQGVITLIESDRVTAYKMQSRWWLVDEPPL